MEVPLYITFHFINAYEEKDEDGRVIAIIADCCEHNADTTILDKLRLNNLKSFNGQDVLPDARYTPLICLVNVLTLYLIKQSINLFVSFSRFNLCLGLPLPTLHSTSQQPQTVRPK